MRSWFRLLAPALLAFACLPACADGVADPGGLGPIRGTVETCDDATLESPDLEHVNVPLPDASPTYPFAPEAAGDVCACETSDCVTDWIEEHVGCDVCVTLVCDDGPTGGCVRCPSDTTTTTTTAAAHDPDFQLACVAPEARVAHAE